MNLTEQAFEKVTEKILSLAGKSENFPVYRIPIDLLKYNIKNGRIATYVSEYQAEGKRFPDSNDELNFVIEQYIEQSNPNELAKTKRNIKLLGQIEPAVVLSNGVVIDGNRRFTSLRQLVREGQGARFEYLNAVILKSGSYNEKDIKRLELNLQHGVAAKIDYNPIDRLVDIYWDLISEKRIFTPEEYARETDMKLAELKKEIAIANLMLDYLKFINQEKKFYIARQQKIDGPLREIFNILNSPKLDKDNEEDIKEILFTSIFTLSGDITREIRDLKKVLLDKEASQELIENLDNSEILDDINDELNQEENIKKVEKEKRVEMEPELTTVFRKMVDESVDNKKISMAQNEPIEILAKAVNYLNKIDAESVNRLSMAQKAEFGDYLTKIEQKDKILRSIINA
ncbi:hypothetical protein PEPE_0534 [Pediococcus pentosaceus ATCC 25745]|uniref:ParB/Sulfiredoxin domain-containing protein n=1 Tax=Pediococcus pentosaceus (strain ATCC 25745 / CCUG 21536 / LMG 10740 / 183-1w) TaxID=278197 RepID=Q03GP9_PEDPA|nr:ParB/RepB/Spo0J family partition protein [Pediococcus pentosaceus]ABJ67623.1 hypothetical protein PEPE_0534 [Pediococcus pentosaceus ATCC 25745]QYY85481.1 hypothetical protein GRI00_02470 [Pediococcus pentosaceus]